MIGAAKIISILMLMLFTQQYSKHLNRDRKTKYYLEDKIKYKADSLLNTWKENALKEL